MNTRTFSPNINDNIFLEESEIYNFPRCKCIYQNGNKFMIIEINSGELYESIKIISPIYLNYTELIKNYKVKQLDYPFLYNYIIYNDKIRSLL